MNKDGIIEDLKYGEDSSQKGNLYIPTGVVSHIIIFR